MILGVHTADTVTQLWLHSGQSIVDQYSWEAGRELSQQLIGAIEQFCSAHGLSLIDLDGIVFFEGPGSYTGLRIGASVVNALGYSYAVPVTAARGEQWLQDGIRKLAGMQHFVPVAPFYDGNARVTPPSK